MEPFSYLRVTKASFRRREAVIQIQARCIPGLNEFRGYAER